MALASARLIDAMLRTADSIEMGTVEYSWSDPSDCNCGLLARCLLNENNSTVFFNKYADELSDLHNYRLDSTWETFGNLISICPVTLLPLGGIAIRLLDAGLSHNDFRELENLSNPAICARAGFTSQGHAARDSQANVVAYLRAWAALLQSELDAAAPAEAMELVTA